MSLRDSRRSLLSLAGGAAALLAAKALYAEDKSPDKDDVGAVEDLMREHGVIRRVIVAYRETAIRLRGGAAISAEALHRAARLMRNFGEDYHERELEEAHIFPIVKKAGGPAASYVETLLAQHRRGRELTDYVLAVSKKGISAANTTPLADSLDSFARMYEEHTAYEDTLIFPAWKKALTPKEIDELGDQFEEIEHKFFGKDGFDDAVEKIAAIEQTLGIKLRALTAAPPPKL